VCGTDAPRRRWAFDLYRNPFAVVDEIGGVEVNIDSRGVPGSTLRHVSAMLAADIEQLRPAPPVIGLEPRRISGIDGSRRIPVHRRQRYEPIWWRPHPSRRREVGHRCRDSRDKRPRRSRHGPERVGRHDVAYTQGMRRMTEYHGASGQGCLIALRRVDACPGRDRKKQPGPRHRRTAKNPSELARAGSRLHPLQASDRHTVCPKDPKRLRRGMQPACRIAAAPRGEQDTDDQRNP